jgi:hypothetical protein
VCGPEQVCAGGTCSSNCLSGQTLCTPDAGPYYCATTATDNANCGTCGNTCDALHVCAGGKCANTCLSNQIECLPDGGTDGGSTQPYCADPKNDNLNCGGCGIPCPSNQPFCSGGVCTSLG